MTEPAKYQNLIESVQENLDIGKKQLTAGQQRWLQLIRAIGAVMEPEVQR